MKLSLCFSILVGFLLMSAQTTCGTNLAKSQEQSDLKKIKKTPSEKPKKIEKKNKPKSKEFCPIYCGTAFLDNCKNLEGLKLIKFFKSLNFD